MASNKIIRIPPVTIPTATANFYTPYTLSVGIPADSASSGVYAIIRHIRVVNKSAVTAAQFGLFLGVSLGNVDNTQVIASAVSVASGTPGSAYSTGGISVAPNSFFEWYGALRVQSAEFLTMLGNVASTTILGLVIQAEGEVGIV